MLCCSRCGWPLLGGFSLGTAIRAAFRWAVVWRLSELTVQAQRTPLGSPHPPLLIMWKSEGGAAAQQELAEGVRATSSCNTV